MSLFDGEPITLEETIAQRRRNVAAEGATIRKVSASGKVYTVRHKPWWMLLGKGPAGYTCGDCHYLQKRRYASTYFKCTRQVMTMGAGTDIRKGDDACRLWHLKGFPMFTIKKVPY